MHKVLLAGVALTLFGVSTASAGVIEDRQALMKIFNDANIKMLLFTRDTYKSEDAVAQFQILLNGAAKLGSLFPEGSDVGNTKALPTIWQYPLGFQGALDKFVADVKTAQTGSNDVDSFAASFNIVAKDCDACHMTYRAKRR